MAITIDARAVDDEGGKQYGEDEVKNMKAIEI